MIIHRDFENLTIENPVLTIGTYDGVHKGHQTILQKVKDKAAQIKGESVVLSFWPHPRLITQPDAVLQLLNTFDEKIDLLNRFGIDHFIALPFTKELSQMEAVDFVQDLLIDKIGTKSLIVGYDHRFGKGRKGDEYLLKEYARKEYFDLEIIPAFEVDNINISSTKIREALNDGDIDKAAYYLGYNYFVTGQVVQGDMLGRKLGFPTANVDVDERLKLLPKPGVYACRIFVEDKSYGGMLNVGVRPTVTKNKELRFETHIFDFNYDIYGKKIKVEFISRIRDELKMPGIEALKNQLIEDKKKALSLLAV